MDRSDTLRFAQVNAHRSRGAAAQVRQILADEDIDICLLQEPSLFQGKVLGLPLTARIVQLQTSECRVATVVLRRDVDILVKHVSPYVVVVTVRWSQQEFDCINVYAPPSERLERVLREAEGFISSETIVAGDLNGHHVLWGSRHINERGAAIEDFCSVHGLYVLNDPESLPTFQSHRGDTWIDLTLCTGRLLAFCHNWTVMDQMTGSDHNLIRFDLTEQQTSPLSVVRHRYQVKRANWSEFSKQLQCENLPALLAGWDHPDEKVRVLTSCLQSVCDRTIPRKRPPMRRSAPWWNRDLQVQRSRVRALRRRARKAKTQIERDHFRPLYNRENALYKRAIAKAKELSWRRYLFEISSKDTFGVPYQLATGKVYKPVEIHSLCKADGSRTTTTGETLGYLLEVLFPKDTPDSSHQAQLRGESLSPPDSVDDPPFTPAEVTTTISCMALGKAPGVDGLSLEIVKALHGLYPGMLADLFSTCLAQGIFPAHWKTASLVLFNKPGKDSSHARSYRPICLLTAVGKLLDKLISQRVFFHLKQRHWLSDKQFGFMPGKSTTHALHTLLTAIRSNKCNGRYTSLVSLDIEGAFDNVWWPAILVALKDAKCPRNLYSLVQSYLSERKVVLQTPNGDLERVTERGCPQGSCSGPLFWNLVANSALLLVLPEGVTMQAYADDFVLLVEGKSRRDLESRGNEALRKLEEWSTLLKLSFSAPKSVAVTFSPRRRLRRDPIFRLAGRTIINANEVTILGVTLDKPLSFLPHLEKVRQRVTIVTHSLARMARNTWGLRGEILLDIYSRCIERIITYGAGAWWLVSRNLTMVRKLTSIQRIALLRCCRAFRTVSSDSLQVLCGVLPIQYAVESESVTWRVKNGLLNDLPDGMPLSELERVDDIWRTHPVYWRQVSWSKGLPSDPGLCIFTDGSKDGGNVGAAYHAVFPSGAFISRGFRLIPEATNFQAEAVAMLQALLWLSGEANDDHTEQTAVLTDCMSLLEALANPRCTNVLVNDVKRAYFGAVSRRSVRLYWVKGHSGIAGNEQADKLAKQASRSESQYPYRVPLALEALKSRLRGSAVHKWQGDWSGSQKGRALFRFLPRVGFSPHSLDFFANQMLTGHGRFPEYLHRIRAADSDACGCGTAPGNALHYLTACPLTEGFQTDFWKGQQRDIGNLQNTLTTDSLVALRSLGRFINRFPGLMQGD